MRRLPRLPYVLLGAMTFVSFGGPFVILVGRPRRAERQLAPRSACRMGHDRRGLRPGHRALRRLRDDRLVVSPSRGDQGAAQPVTLAIVMIISDLSY